MEAKHTEGPWVVASGGNIIAESAHFGFTVASVETFTGRSVCPPDERHANAHLIAAAPELLAALRGLCETMTRDDDGDYFLPSQSQDDGEPVCEVVDRAYAAIARAEGRTP